MAWSAELAWARTWKSSWLSRKSSSPSDTIGNGSTTTMPRPAFPRSGRPADDVGAFSAKDPPLERVRSSPGYVRISECGPTYQERTPPVGAFALEESLGRSRQSLKLETQDVEACDRIARITGRRSAATSGSGRRGVYAVLRTDRSDVLLEQPPNALQDRCPRGGGLALDGRRRPGREVADRGRGRNLGKDDRRGREEGRAQ